MTIAAGLNPPLLSFFAAVCGYSKPPLLWRGGWGVRLVRKKPFVRTQTAALEQNTVSFSKKMTVFLFMLNLQSDFLAFHKPLAHWG